MPKKNEEYLIEMVKRCLKKQAGLDKCIKRLRAQKQLDVMINFDKTSMTLLMYFVKENQFSRVKELLSGENAANPLIVNSMGVNALSLAVSTKAKNCEFDINIIDELLKHQPQAQLITLSDEGYPLHRAIKSGQLDLVKKFLQLGPIEQLSFIKKWSAIYLAVVSLDEEMVDWVLSVCPEKQVLLEDESGILPLDFALVVGQQNIAQKLLRFEPQQQLAHKTPQGKTIFNFMVREEKNKELAQWLINSFPGILDLFTDGFFGPLHFACHIKDVQLVKLLLEKKPSMVLLRDNYNAIPLFEACISDQVEIVTLLLQHSFHEQLASTDESAQNIIHICCTFGAEKSLAQIIALAEKNNLQKIDHLVLKKDVDGFFPIFRVLSSNFSINKMLSLLRLLLKIESNKQLEVKDANDFLIPLTCAIELNQLEILEFFLKEGPATQLELPLEMMDKMLPPLVMAIIKKNVPMVKLFLDYHTEPHFLRMNDSSMPPLPAAIWLKHPEIFRLLIESKFLPTYLNAPANDTGNAPIHVAIIEKNYEAFLVLIEKGADVNSENLEGWTPLLVASEENLLPFAQQLIKHKANLLHVNHRGDTALHVAAVHGSVEIIKELVKYNLELDRKNSSGETPLFLAIFDGYNEVIDVLLRHGADANIEIKLSQETSVTPLYLAICLFNFDMLALFFKYKNNLDQTVLLKNEKPISLGEFITSDYKEKPKIYSQFKQLLPNLPDIKQALINFKHNENDQRFIASDQALSPRQFLLNMGYSKDEIELFEAERKANKQKLNQHTDFFNSSSSQDRTSKSEVITWLNGKFSSENKSLFSIPSLSNNLCFGYFDHAVLLEQNCDISKLNHKRVKFDGYHLKKLDSKKGVYCEKIKLTNREGSSEVTYTHEFKINETDRILFFPLLSDDNKACLFIGSRYISGGFHTQAKINSLLASIKSEQHCLQINLPDDSEQINLEYIAAP